ncbi:short chain dehydrogenase family protein, partial [Vibrio parahaemolyticus VPTS-2010_2]
THGIGEHAPLQQ